MNIWDKLHRSRSLEGLARQVASGEIPHAWLLLGPSGSGKRAAAKAVAAALNCPQQPGIGCGVCSTCARIVRGRHPDVHHIAPEGPLIPVDVIREIVIPEAARSPFEGHRKVFIIEEADRMNEPAQNAILKTLEEPQPDTVFVLLSANEEEVLPTIHSRCRVVRLEPVSESRIVELLEEDGADTERALLSARLAGGDFERARQLSEDDVVLARRDGWLALTDLLVSPIDAMDAAEEVITLTRAAVKEHETLQKEEVQELAEAMGEGRGTAAARNALAKRHKRELKRLEEELLGEALGTLASFYRDVIATRRGASESVTNLDRLEVLEHWSRSDSDDASLVAAIERLVTTRTALAQNANVPLAIEAALLYVTDRVSPPVPLDTWA